MTIITDELLADIEAKAKAATQGDWQTTNVPLVNKRFHKIVGPIIAKNDASDEDLSFIARMDPPTTLSLVAAYRSAQARIAELEAALSLAVTAGKARIRVEQNNAQEIRDAAITDSQEVAKEAHRAALDEAAKVAADFINGRLYEPKFPACSYHAEECAATIRSLKDKEPAR